MIKASDIVLFRFPQVDLGSGKFRPGLLVGRLPGEYDDWLMCMISSQRRHFIPDFDELVDEKDPDFQGSGLKVPSIIRVGRLAVVQGDLLMGAIGEISTERLQRIKMNLAEWLTS